MRIVLKGDKELERKLKDLNNKVAKKIVRTAVRDSATIMKEQVQANIRSVVGSHFGELLANNVTVRAFRRQRAGAYGVSTKFQEYETTKLKSNYIHRSLIHITKTGKRYFIPTAIEYGHAAPGFGGSGRKDVAAMPFFRPAFDTKKDVCLKNIETKTEQGINSVWGK